MNKKFLTALVSLFVFASSVLALNGFNNTSSAAIDNTPDCDTVAIIKCGAYSESELRTDAAKGDVPKVFSAFGISQSELSGFVSGAVMRDGTVVVGDKVVATGAITAGRWNNPTSDMTRIAGTDRAYKMSTKHFVDEGQTAFIKMVNGQFSFAVIKSCGNPVTAKPMPKPPTPTYACVSLTKQELNRTSYRFTAKATAGGGAKVTGYRYDFGDGTVITGPNTQPGHTYAKPGTYTAKVTALVSVNGKTVEANGPNCTVSVTVTPPPATPVYKCDSLTATLINQADHTYSYTLNYTAEGGATLRDVDFNYGDGSSQSGVKPADLGNVRHSYKQPGTYTTTTTLHFTVGTAVKDSKCQVKVEIPKPNECKPGIPVGDARCEECKPGIPKNDARCEETPPPVEIAKTGPAELAFGGLGIGSIAGAGYYWRVSRRNLINKLLNK